MSRSHSAQTLNALFCHVSFIYGLYLFLGSCSSSSVEDLWELSLWGSDRCVWLIKHRLSCGLFHHLVCSHAASSLFCSVFTVSYPLFLLPCVGGPWPPSCCLNCASEWRVKEVKSGCLTSIWTASKAQTWPCEERLWETRSETSSAFSCIGPGNWIWTVHSTSRPQTAVIQLTFESFCTVFHVLDQWVLEIGVCHHHQKRRSTDLCDETLPSVRCERPLIILSWTELCWFSERQDWAVKRLNQMKPVQRRFRCPCLCSVFSSC